MNSDAIKRFRQRVTNVRNLNFKLQDFQNLEYKKIIQDIFDEVYFTSLQNGLHSLTSDFVGDTLESSIKKLQRDPKYLELFNNVLSGSVGPGEMVVYLLTNKSTLSGRQKSGDINQTNGAVYEVKAIPVSGTARIAKDVAVGGTVDFSSVINKLVDLGRKHNISVSRSSTGNTIIRSLREKDKETFEEIEKEYRATVYKGYFSKFGLILFGSTGSSKGHLIKLYHKGELSPEKISLHRISSFGVTSDIALN